MSTTRPVSRELARLESEFIAQLSAWKLSEQELQTVVAQRTKLQSQLEEVTLVLDEMERLEPDAPLYKMIGPVLQPVVVSAGLQQIQQRKSYIEGELQRAVTRAQKLGEQQREKRMMLMKLQQQLPNIPDSIYAV